MGSLGVHILAVPKGCPYEVASMILHGGVIPKDASQLEIARRGGCAARQSNEIILLYFDSYLGLGVLA